VTCRISLVLTSPLADKLIKCASATPRQAGSWVEKTPGICGGDACVRNTRHTVSGLVQWRRLGLSDARILEHHPDLTQADLDAAWSYFAQHGDEIDRAIKEDEEA
jgi:uncharacterized protein (DUF433 family)